jgi:hypothetical protein
MKLFTRSLAALACVAVLSVCSGRAAAQDEPAQLAAAFRSQVDRKLEVPSEEIRRYGVLAEASARAAGVKLGQEYVAVVDRDPYVQALLLMWRSADGEYRLIGASPVSTGRPGTFDHFETPLGVFEHSRANPDYRAEGTFNENGIRGYGLKGMRVYDFGWQQVPKGWGDGQVIQMRLQMHATDPDALEQRLGSAQSKGCIRIPATLNRLIDFRGLLDADYNEATQQGAHLWVLRDDREPVTDAGRYLIVVDTQRSEPLDWSPRPPLPHRAPVKRAR